MRHVLTILLTAWTLSGQAPLARIEVSADHTVVAGTPVEASLDDKAAGPLRVTLRGNRIPVPAQFSNGTLTFLLPKVLEAGKPQTFEVRRGMAAPPEPAIEVKDGVDHQGHESVEVRTAGGTWMYHKEGGGFGALIDNDGNDWITWRPGKRSAGEYRGIPNLGVYAHPGYTGEKGGTTTIVSAGPLHVRLRSESRSGDYMLLWDFYPRFARLTIEKAGQPYWFLYEGTPGGTLDVDGDFVVTADGRRRLVSEAWSGDLPSPEWLYFGDVTGKRALFLVNHKDDNANDQFWQMEGNMTVFGFGREHRCCGRYMTAAPAQFTVGLVDSVDHEQVRRAVESSYLPVNVKVIYQ